VAARATLIGNGKLGKRIAAEHIVEHAAIGVSANSRSTSTPTVWVMDKNRGVFRP
jgi:hypothetical protein